MNTHSEPGLPQEPLPAAQAADLDPAAAAVPEKTPAELNRDPDRKLFTDLGLAPDILKAIAALGFEQPSPIQAQAIPPALEGRDVVGQSHTGSGKTMAFAIPAVQMLDARDRGVRVLIMCPTRELAIQVCEEVAKLTAHKHGIKAVPIYGGATYHRQIRGLQEGAQIVVGTPGRILDFIERGMLRLEDLKMLVFDEADEMLDMGFRDEIERLVSLLPAERQTLFFSATLDGPIRRLVESFTRDPAVVTVKHKAMTVSTVEQRYYEVLGRSKIEVLCRILDMENPRLAIIFGNTKKTVDDVTDALLARGYGVDRLHGDLNQMLRDRVMKNFRAGSIEVLAATDVAARGLDVDDVDLVVNFDLPFDEEDYVHRIGRTGRAGRSGKAVSLVSGREIFLLQRIQRYAKVRVERHKVPSRDEVDGKRVDSHFEKLQATLEEGKFKSHEATVQRLLDSGYNSTDIASALLHLWLNDASRETEEIPEDRPRPERAPRPERRDGYESRNQPEQRGGFEPRQNFDQPRGDGPPPRRPVQQDGYTRMFINLGGMDEVRAGDIAGVIYKTSGIPQGAVGRIDVLEKCSFVMVPDEFAQQVEQSVTGAQWRGRDLRMNQADSQGGGFGGAANFDRRPTFGPRSFGGGPDRKPHGPPRSSGYGGGGYGGGFKGKFSGGHSGGGGGGSHGGGYKKKGPAPF
ncbi:MAG: DEAD/DEAH box helicase, partial [Roseimicrobium sp.]